MLNLIPLILQTDSTRVVTLMIQDHGVVPNIAGIQAEHHNLSHHGQDPQKIRQLKIIEKAILNCFADFLSRLAAPSEGSTRLLDQTSVLFGSNLGNANAHDPANLPIIVAGGGYQHGRYVAGNESNNTPLCNLFVNLLTNMGIETDQFGTSTGRLDFFVTKKFSGAIRIKPMTTNPSVVLTLLMMFAANAMAQDKHRLNTGINGEDRTPMESPRKAIRLLRGAKRRTSNGK